MNPPSLEWIAPSLKRMISISFGVLTATADMRSAKS